MSRPSRQRQRGDERGAAVGLTPALVLLLVVLAMTIAALTSVVTAHRQAQAAADLAALAAARAIQDGESPCARAGEIARGNRARVTACTTHDFEARVEVAVRSVPLPGGALLLHARARAGPVSLVAG